MHEGVRMYVNLVMVPGNFAGTVLQCKNYIVLTVECGWGAIICRMLVVANWCIAK